MTQFKCSGKLNKSRSITIVLDIQRATFGKQRVHAGEVSWMVELRDLNVEEAWNSFKTKALQQEFASQTIGKACEKGIQPLLDIIITLRRT